MPKYIYQRKNGWFEIRKRVGGTLLYWGSFPTLEEAVRHRDYYARKKWKVTPSFKANRHIVRKNDHTFMIMKQTGKVRDCYGTFDDIHTARRERDICLECDWDFDAIANWVD